MIIITALVISICLVGVLSSNGTDASDEDGKEFTIGDFEYRIVSELEKVAKIKFYNGFATELTVPSKVTYDDVIYDITAIGDDTFSGCSSLTSVVIPEGIKFIGTCAFSGCVSLTSVTLPDGLKYIDALTFDYCTSLTSVTIPDSVKSIEPSTFRDCTSLTSVTIGNGVKSIEYNVFKRCASLKTIVICGNESISSKFSAYTDCHADLKFVTNKTGHTLTTYSDADHTTVLSMKTIRTTDCTIYFKTTVNQSTITFDTDDGTVDPTTKAMNIGIVIGGVTTVIVLVDAGISLFMRRGV